MVALTIMALGVENRRDRDQLQEPRAQKGVPTKGFLSSVPNEDVSTVPFALLRASGMLIDPSQAS